MSHSGRPPASHLRHPSMGHIINSNGQSPMLVARIHEKKIELENLKQLRDLSGQLAGQMQMLEDKLATLANGTEAIAAVMSNWHNVLRAINMASMKIPKPKELYDQEDADQDTDSSIPLPVTLVRVPVEQHIPAAAGNGDD